MQQVIIDLQLTCLSLMQKLWTGVIPDQIYACLHQEKLLPEDQKWCRKGSIRGTNDLLYIDRTVIKEVKSIIKNLLAVAENIKSLLYGKVGGKCYVQRTLMYQLISVKYC